MTDDTSRPSKRSWKGEDRSARRARGPDALWKRRAREEGRPAPFFSRNARIVWAAIACLLGIGLIVWLILMIAPVRPASVILVGADYATNLAVPHNVFGWEGLQGIRALTLVPRDKGFWSRPGLRGARPDRIALKDATHWDEVLDNLKSKGFSGDTIVIVLALHGASDASGKAYLLPPARPSRRTGSSWRRSSTA